MSRALAAIGLFLGVFALVFAVLMVTEGDPYFDDEALPD